MKNAILNNTGFKLLALFLAVITWYYIAVELRKGGIEEREVMQSLLPYSMESKLVPIELNMTGEPQRGFMIELDRIKIEPSRCVIIGPKSLLRKLEIVRTSPVDIAGTTKTIVKDVSIDLLAEDIALKEKFVTISIPIIRVEE